MIRDLFILFGVLLAIAMHSAPALGQQGLDQNRPPAQARNEFSQLLSERADVYQSLRQIDAQAAQAVLDGEDPVDLYARQTALQERLDLLELRLGVLATRYDMELPTVEQQINDTDGDGQADPRDAQARAHMNVGIERTRRQVRRQAEAILASIDFSDFLAETQPIVIED